MSSMSSYSTILVDLLPNSMLFTPKIKLFSKKCLKIKDIKMYFQQILTKSKCSILISYVIDIESKIISYKDHYLLIKGISH